VNVLVTTQPAAEPISSTEAKAHLRVDHTDDDTLIGALITAARMHCENFTRRKLISQTLTGKLDRFPADDGEILLPYPPLVSVTSVKYIDTDGVLQTMSASDYAADTYSLPGRITLAYGEIWPTPRDIENAVTIVWTAGYGAAGSSVPQPIRQAMLLLIAHWYENREVAITGTIITQIPLAVEALLWPYRMLEVP
jgi:uncharacterized phiE125 gp8 family phage protein